MKEYSKIEVFARKDYGYINLVGVGREELIKAVKDAEIMFRDMNIEEVMVFLDSETAKELGLPTKTNLKELKRILALT